MVVVFAMVCFMACGQQAGTPGDGDTGGEAAGTVSIGDANDEYYMITFMNGLEFWKDCYRGFEDAAKIYGAKTVYTGAQEFDINQQITVLEQVLAKNPAGIAITCVNDEALMEPINKAIEQGVEVVVFDSDSPESDRYSILQTGNANAGSKAADQMAEALGGTGEVGVIYTAGTPTHEARAQGIKAVSYTHLDVYKRQGIRRRPSETHRTVQKPKLCTVRCIRLSKHGWNNVVTASEAPHCGTLCPRRQTAGSSFALCTNRSTQYPATGSYTFYAATVQRPDIRLCSRQAQDRLQRRASGAVAL